MDRGGMLGLDNMDRNGMCRLAGRGHCRSTVTIHAVHMITNPTSGETSEIPTFLTSHREVMSHVSCYDLFDFE